VARDVAYQLGELTTDERDQPAYRLSSGSVSFRAFASIILQTAAPPV
jgi:hypothetical protein